MGKAINRLGPVRIGVAGAGRMGSVHIRLLNEMGSLFNLVGVYDPVKEKADVAKKYGATAFYDFEDMLKEVEAIVLACPTSKHKDMALKAAKHGVHVLVEKPAAQNYADAAEMYDIFNKNHLKLTVNHVERFNPVVRTISDLTEGMEVISTEIHRCSPFDSRIYDVDVVTDLMIHDIDVIVNSVMKTEPIKISAFGRNVYGSKFLDYAQAVMEFSCGAIAFITSSRCTEDKIRSIGIHAKSAYIEGDMLRRNLTVKRGVAYQDSTNPKINYTQTNVIQQIILQDKNPLKEELENFGLAVLNDMALLNSQTQVLKTMKALDQIEFALYGGER